MKGNAKGTTGADVLGCLRPGEDEETETWPGFRSWPIIAAQCCTKGDGECRRVHDGECIVGDSKELGGEIERLTYGEVVERCDSLGLTTCGKSCANTGCSYNRHPVYTSVPCEAQASPPPPPPPSSSSPPPPSSSASPPPPSGTPATGGCTTDGWCQGPEGPSQQCADDAGPPWGDDIETFGEWARYHDNTPATPILPPDGKCPGALEAACAAKGVKAAYLEGPVDCGGRGWFCRIYDQPGWTVPYGDKNFGLCANPNGDFTDQDGHCHGSDDDGTYGWWVRDHWFRGYTGELNCCCGWGADMYGVVNRCDYRKPVPPAEVDNCRDANEEHEVDFSPTCAAYPLKPDPVANGGMCWTVRSFASK